MILMACGTARQAGPAASGAQAAIGEHKTIAFRHLAHLDSSGWLNIGPSNTKVWNSPFSPHGSMPDGMLSSSDGVNSRPANPAGSTRGSTQVMQARNHPPASLPAIPASAFPTTGTPPRCPCPACAPRGSGAHLSDNAMHCTSSLRARVTKPVIAVAYCSSEQG